MVSFFPGPDLLTRKQTDANIKVGGRLSWFLPPMGEDHTEPLHPKSFKGGLQIGIPVTPPPNFLITCLPKDPLKARSLLRSVRELAEQEVIIPVSMSQITQGFYSHIFVVPKPSGKFQLIINLWKLNQYLLCKRFPDGEYLYSQKTPSRGSLHDHIRSERCLIACPHCPGTTEVHAFRSSDRAGCPALAVQVTPLRPSGQSKNLYQGSCRGGVFSAPPGDSLDPVLG